jgi:hypothetical protein
MSSPIHCKRGFAGMIVAAALALFAIPASALAAPVNLATVNPFVVLAGAAVTNTGPSVLNGDLGVYPGTALTGFGAPAVINGAIHAADPVALQAKADLSNAYTVASEQPVAPANDLSGTNLGNRVLGPGAYRYSSDALMTGALVLDAQGDPNSQFVFLIGSALTTESASSVVLVNGASPCNVYWQVGSSADIGTTTSFVGNLMAQASISLKTGATVFGRMLAQTGQVSLDTNVLTRPICATGPTSGEGGTGGSSGGSSTPAAGPTKTLPAKGAGKKNKNGKNKNGKNNQNNNPNQKGRAVGRPAPREACTEGFRVAVNGSMIKRVVFSLDGKAILSDTGSPFAVSVRAAPGEHSVRARVTFTDSTPAKTMSFPYRACAAAVLAPRNGPPSFTG